MSIPTRLLGARTGLQVSQIALGTGRLGLRGKQSDESAALATIRAYEEAGGFLFDTSSRYLGGRGEVLVGDATRGRRDEVVIISKYGRTPLARPAAAAAGQHRKALRSEVEGSLKRLGTDYIDVLLAHTDDGVTPIDELVSGMEQLAREGKILHFGLSSFPAWRAATAAAVAEQRGVVSMAALEMHYNLLERAPEREHGAFARARGLAMLAAAPLSGGLLVGNTAIDYDISDEMASSHRVVLEGGPQSPEGMIIRDRQSQAIVDTVVDVAREANASPVAVSIAWLLHQDAIPVIGPRSPEQVGDNLAGLTLRLSDEQLERLSRVSLRDPGFPYAMLDVDRAELGLDISQPAVGAVL